MDAMQPKSVTEWFDIMRTFATQHSQCKDHAVAAAAVTIKDDQVVWSSPFSVNEPSSSCACSKHCLKFSHKDCGALHAEQSLNKYLFLQKEPPKFTHFMVTYQPCEPCAETLRRWNKPILFLEKAQKIIPEGCEWYFSWHNPADWSTLWQDIRAYHRKLNSPDLDAAKASSESKYQQIREACLALFMEVAELVDTHQWKPWRVARVMERKHFIEEMADIFFFMSSLMELHGIPEAEVRQAIADKLETNLNRLKEGYHS